MDALERAAAERELDTITAPQLLMEQVSRRERLRLSGERIRDYARRANLDTVALLDCEAWIAHAAEQTWWIRETVRRLEFLAACGSGIGGTEDETTESARRRLAAENDREMDETTAEERRNAAVAAGTDPDTATEIEWLRAAVRGAIRKEGTGE